MLIDYLKNPDKLFVSLAVRGAFRNMDDAQYLKHMFHGVMGKQLDLRNPTTFNEKLQWLKLYDRNPLYTTLVDKYCAKEYFEKQIGSQYVIPTLGVYNSFDEINFDQLPSSFVLKATHDSGTVIICKDKATFDLPAARRRIEKALLHNFYYPSREWPYKNVAPRIIVEEYLSSIESESVVEYKIFCFNGNPTLFLVCKGTAHGNGRTNDFYDLDFNHIPVRVTYPNSPVHEQKPKEYNELLEIAKKLSAGISQVRVDTYVVNGQIYIGEMTFFHDGGYCKFQPDSYDAMFGKMVQLPCEKRC